MTATLDSPEGEKAVLNAAGAVLDDVFYGPALVEIEVIVKEITLQVLEHMMDVVSVKKWATPTDQQPRPPMPWESDALDATDQEHITEDEPGSDSET